ncbi:MAG: hypothetical protein LBL66_07475, partial [Clostridiales bacterium]|nr:hypothetical protein [Clostridiales bacterium]
MEKTLKAKKEESALERFMEQKPIVYGVVIMTALAVLCGAVLGLAGLFLRAPEQAGINDRERAILEIIMPSEEYELFEEDGADYASDKKTFKIERVYIATGAQNKGNAAVMAGGTGYNGGAIKSITAFDKADDTVLG